MANETLLTVAEVAEMLRVKPITVRRLAAKKRIKCVPVGTGDERQSLRFRRSDVDAFIKRGAH